MKLKNLIPKKTKDPYNFPLFNFYPIIIFSIYPHLPPLHNMFQIIQRVLFLIPAYIILGFQVYSLTPTIKNIYKALKSAFEKNKGK